MTISIDGLRNGYYDVSGVNTGDFFAPMVSGDYISSAVMASAIAAASVGANTIFFTPCFISKGRNFTGLAFSSVVVTTASYKLGVYASNGDKKATGLPISGTTGTLGPLTTAAATSQPLTFGAPIYFPSGLYWIALLGDTAGTVGVSSAASGAWFTGTADISVNQSRRMTFAQTYASGLPDMTANQFTAATGTNLIMGLRVE